MYNIDFIDIKITHRSLFDTFITNALLLKV